jgi:hypothetical protein
MGGLSAVSSYHSNLWPQIHGDFTCNKSICSRPVGHEVMIWNDKYSDTKGISMELHGAQDRGRTSPITGFIRWG